eukprot:1627462-Amphidinium_carterae.2
MKEKKSNFVSKTIAKRVKWFLASGANSRVPHQEIQVAHDAQFVQRSLSLQEAWLVRSVGLEANHLGRVFLEKIVFIQFPSVRICDMCRARSHWNATQNESEKCRTIP